MIDMDLTQELVRTMAEYPVVTLMGPSQAGKATLTRQCFLDFSCTMHEDPAIRNLAATDSKAFFKKHPEPLIIDEVQRVPDIPSSVQVIVDEDRQQRAVSFNASFVASLNRFCEAEPESALPILVYDGESYPERSGATCLNYRKLHASVLPSPRAERHL